MRYVSCIMLKVNGAVIWLTSVQCNSQQRNNSARLIDWLGRVYHPDSTLAAKWDAQVKGQKIGLPCDCLIHWHKTTCIRSYPNLSPADSQNWAQALCLNWLSHGSGYSSLWVTKVIGLKTWVDGLILTDSAWFVILTPHVHAWCEEFLNCHYFLTNSNRP